MGRFVTIDVSNIDKFKRTMDKISYLYKKSLVVKEELNDIADDMRNYMIDGMTNTKKSSVGYKRGTKTHFPSLPGEMPARDTGGLIKLIFHDQSFNKLEFGIMAGAPYSVFLEEGTVNMEASTVKMEARPFLQPTVEHFEPDIERRLWNKIKEVTV